MRYHENVQLFLAKTEMSNNENVQLGNNLWPHVHNKNVQNENVQNENVQNENVQYENVQYKNI